jgi:hypothetical protein
MVTLIEGDDYIREDDLADKANSFLKRLVGFFGGQNRFNKLESDLLKQSSKPLLVLDY